MYCCYIWMARVVNYDLAARRVAEMLCLVCALATDGTALDQEHSCFVDLTSLDGSVRVLGLL